MFSLLEAFFTQYGYVAVFLVLVACGLGVPIPEDVTLVTGGVIAGLGHANVHTMFLVGMVSKNGSILSFCSRVMASLDSGNTRIDEYGRYFNAKY